MASRDKILKFKNLSVHFPIKSGIFARTTDYVRAVNNVSFDMDRGETLGVVGESGSGKSTLAKVIMGLIKPTDGKFELGGRVAMVFQDPLGSLNPRMTIRSALEEVCETDRALPPNNVLPEQLLKMVGLGDDALDKYPHEFSGGQRQRICIARAIAARPELLICDEAVSALDLSIRSQILSLLSQLKAELNLSLLFITHDLGVVRHFADRVIVMHQGEIEEVGTAAKTFDHPQTEYTKKLLAAIPRLNH